MIIIFAPHVIDRFTYCRSTDRPGIQVTETISRPGCGGALLTVCRSLGGAAVTASALSWGAKNRIHLDGIYRYRFDTPRRPLDRWRRDCAAAAELPAAVWILANYEQAFDRPFATGLLEQARARGILTICDPHRSDPAIFAGCDVLKTNDLAAADRQLAAWTIATRGADGMVVFGADHPQGRYIAPVPVREVDATGCGDTVSAVLAIELARGGGIYESALKAAELAARQATLGPGVMPLRPNGVEQTC